ncbi:MAG: hypothetical protein R3C03_08915 [Pirellulaceae bacterium]
MRSCKCLMVNVRLLKSKKLLIANMPQRLTLAELNQFVGMLHRTGLVISDIPGQGTELLKRHRKSEAKTRQQNWTNVLAFRFKGFDPDGVLTFLNRWIGGFFSLPAFTVVAMILFSCSGVTVYEL